MQTLNISNTSEQPSDEINTINENLKNTIRDIEITYKYESGGSRDGYVRHYTKQAYDFANLEKFIQDQITSYDKPLRQPKSSFTEDVWRNTSTHKSSRDDLIKTALSKMSAIVNAVKWQTAEKHMLAYMQQHNIPLIPPSQIKYKKDSFISNYGNDKQKKHGIEYGVITSNPFPKDASPDVKLLSSKIWEENNESDILQKRQKLSHAIYDLLKAYLTKEEWVKRNCDLFGFRVKRWSSEAYYAGETDSRSYEKKTAGTVISRFDMNNKNEIEISFLIQIDNTLYSCPIEQYKEVEELITLQREEIVIQPSLNFYTHFNSPTCGPYYISSEENFKMLGIVNLFRGKWDRSYSLPEGRFDQAMNNILPPEELQIFIAAEKQIKDIESNYALFLESRERQKKIMDTLSVVKDISKKDLLAHMPAFIEHLIHVDSAQSIQIDIANKLATYIRGYSDYNGSWGSEYGLYITAWYNGELQEKKVVYRDRYDSKRDDRGLCFKTLKVISADKSADWTKIIIKLLGKSDTKERSYEFTFDVNEEVNTPKLNATQQKEFTKTYETAKQSLMHEQGEDFQRRGVRTMPVYCLPAEMCYNGMSSENVPYEAPRIVSEHMDPTQWRWALIIRTQIDHNAGHKRQFEREGYVINQDGSYTQVFRECAWDIEKKEIRYTAESLLKDK